MGEAALEDLGCYVAHEDEGYLRGDLALNGRGALLDLGAEANGDVLDFLRYFLTVASEGLEGEGNDFYSGGEGGVLLELVLAEVFGGEEGVAGRCLRDGGLFIPYHW